MENILIENNSNCNSKEKHCFFLSQMTNAFMLYGETHVIKYIYK